MSEGLEAGLATARKRVRGRLDTALAALPGSTVTAAMRHALGGGKGLRGFLVIESARLHAIAPGVAVHAAAGIEAMHAYSLVHDDLPAMDNDPLRRGRPTVHVAWDEATAILAGDALQSLAFELVTDPDGRAQGALARGLARAAGAAGMVHGQSLDIAAESAAQDLDLPEIEALQAGKTGALFRWSATSGPVMAGSESLTLDAYAVALGLAFQIADDLLDVSGDAGRLGKRVGKDRAAGKATFVSLLGETAARARAHALSDAACDALAPFGPDADALRALARFAVTRDR